MTLGLLPPRPLRLAAAAWPLDWHDDTAGFRSKLDRWLSEAATEGVTHAVLPEYMGLEAVFTGPKPAQPPSVAQWCARAADAAPAFAAVCADLARRHGVTLLSGSLPTRDGGVLRNRAWLCQPDGTATPHDKQILTPWERAETPLSPGAGMTVHDTEDGRLGVLICYDSEFPALSRALTPDLLLIPACTDAPAGDTRVRNAARARALEEQAVTVHAPLIGAMPVCPIVDVNTGRAGIYGPPDHGFPDDGILAQGNWDTPGWVIVDLPAGAVSTTRTTGAVAPRAHVREAAERATQVEVAPARQQTP